MMKGSICSTSMSSLPALGQTSQRTSRNMTAPATCPINTCTMMAAGFSQVENSDTITAVPSII